MKQKIINIVGIFFLVIGITLLLYPEIISYLKQKQSNQTVKKLTQRRSKRKHVCYPCTGGTGRKDLLAERCPCAGGITGDDEEILLFTRYGQCIRFKEADVRATGRTTMGVIGMNLTAGDEVIAMQMASQGESVMIVSENGLGKCTRINEFTTQNRGGKGVKCYKITEKSGNLIGVKSVVKDDELMLITTEGIIIRIRVNDTALLGRVTSGVKLIDLKSGVTVASIARVVEDKSLMPPEEEATEENETEGDPS